MRSRVASGPAWAEPVPFPPAGCRVAHRRETERHATAVHAGGTPALPGGPAPITLASQGRTRRLAGPQPCPCAPGWRQALLGPSPCRSRRQGAGWPIAGKLSGTLRQCMRAGRPRSRVDLLPLLLLLKGERAGLRGRSPAHALPGGARALLRPSPCGFGLQRAGWPIPGKLSGTLRQCMRARRPRSRVGLLPLLLLLKGERTGLPGRSPAHALPGGPAPITLASQGGMRRLAGSQPPYTQPGYSLPCRRT